MFRRPPVRGSKIDGFEDQLTLKQVTYALLAPLALVLGSILAGVATPTESAAPGAAGVAAAPATLAAPGIARAQAKHEWKLATSLPKNLPGPGASSFRWADRITKISGGELTVKV